MSYAIGVGADSCAIRQVLEQTAVSYVIRCWSSQLCHTVSYVIRCWRGQLCHNWKCHRAAWRPPDFSEKTQTEVVRHVTLSSGLAKTILQGTVQGGRRRGRQRKRWEDNIKEWTGLEWNIILWKAQNHEEWKKLVVISTVVPQRSA